MTVKYIPLDKRGKKERRRHYAAQRADWHGVVPVTRIIPNKKRISSCRQRQVDCEDW